ncbi:DUF4192 family protein [Sinomonas mesophila]|uniref:DUF4192 family protein n=1 Tax=Sinomonas mesophila TaxID=1531955 RepID=UPI000985CE50|nr:DUF4192 family protein [Sinomonas mesophila]
MKKTLTIDGPASMLAHIDHSFGRTPQDSVVVITIGRTGHLGAGLRMLLTEDQDPDRTAARIMHLATSATTESIFVAVYTEDPKTAAVIGEHVHERAACLGLDVFASVHVTTAGWQRLDRPGQSGTAQEVQDSVISAEMIARGSVVLDAAPADVPFTGAPDAAERIAAVAPKRPAAAVAWWHALINADQPIIAADAYQLAAALSRPSELRDRLIAATIGTGREPSSSLGTLLLGKAGTNPDWHRAEKAAARLTEALAHTPAGHRAGILAALGWLAWLKGHGTAADAWITRAREDNSRYRLANLLGQLIHRELAPVAMNPDTAYQRHRP